MNQLQKFSSIATALGIVIILSACSSSSTDAPDPTSAVDASGVTATSPCSDLTSIDSNQMTEVIGSIEAELGLAIDFQDDLLSYCADNPDEPIDAAARIVTDVSYGTAPAEEPGGAANGDVCATYTEALTQSVPAVTELDPTTFDAPFAGSLPALPDCILQVPAGAENQFYMLWEDADFTAVHSGLNAAGFVDIRTWDSPDGTEKKYTLSSSDGTGVFPLDAGTAAGPMMPDQAVLFVWAR